MDEKSIEEFVKGLFEKDEEKVNIIYDLQDGNQKEQDQKNQLILYAKLGKLIQKATDPNYKHSNIKKEQ